MKSGLKGTEAGTLDDKALELGHVSFVSIPRTNPYLQQTDLHSESCS